MPRTVLPFSLPPFTGWVRRIILACAGIFLFEVVLKAISLDRYNHLLFYFSLIPSEVLRGKFWQLVTYAFLHKTFGHLLFNMLTLWFMGSWLARGEGERRSLECYSFSTVGAALVTIAVSYTGVLGMKPDISTIGASGGVLGVLMAIGMLYPEDEITLFPIPLSLKAKYLVGIWAFFVIVSIFESSEGGVANFAHLGGLLFGFLYVKFMPRRGASFAASEKYFGLRNSYYRWKRRRAARKFEVYMRDHDRKVTFDEHGNYVPPDDDKKNGGSKSGWVN